MNADAAPKTVIGWGHQIRSYVLQPYQMVKDLRTGPVSGTPAEVLDGDLDPFMESSLAQRLSGRTVVVEDVEKTEATDRRRPRTRFGGQMNPGKT